MTTDPDQTPRDPRQPDPQEPGAQPGTEPGVRGAGESGETPQYPQSPQSPQYPQYPQSPPPPQPGPYEPYGPGATGPQEPAGQPGAYGQYGQQGPYEQYGQYGPAGTAVPPPPAGGAYAYAAPQGPPVPAGLRDIWRKWLNVTTRPSIASFNQELPTANWRDIWLTLIGLGILTAITGAITALYTRQTFQIPQTDGTTTTVNIPAGTSWFSIISVPLAFFIGVAILFVAAKIFRGRGTFLAQSYAMALFYVPIQAAIAIVGLVPIFGGLVAFALGIYEIILAVFAIAASHRLTTGTSVIVVLLPAFLVFLLVCGLLVALAATIAAILNNAR